MLTAVLVIGSGDADSIVASVGPETGDLPRTRATVRSEGSSAVVEITAADPSAMRAALNSYLECIAITEDIENIIR